MQSSLSDIWHIIINQRLTPMQRLRKKSLSPCYSTANKQNLPIENLTTPIGISFKTLEEARKKKTIDHLPQETQPNMSLNQYFYKQNCSPSPHASFKGSKPTGEITRRESQKSIDQYRSSLKSKEKQMSSLHSQVSTLTSTISILKEQVASLKKENIDFSRQNAELRKKIKDKDEGKKDKDEGKKDKQETIQQCKDCNKHNQDFSEVIEKLNELQEIQDKLLQQNESLKKKEKMNTAMFKNLKTLFESNRMKEVRDLLSLLNQ